MDTDNDEDYIVLKKSFHHHHDLISNVKQVDTKLTPSGTFWQENFLFKLRRQTFVFHTFNVICSTSKFDTNLSWNQQTGLILE